MADIDTSPAGTSPQATQATSLLDSVQAQEQPSTDQQAEWFLGEGIKGSGAMPEWFNGKKYKTVADQAKAQRELEKKLGAFTGAPDDYALPDGITDVDESRLSSMKALAKKLNMSQDGFNDWIKEEAERADADIAAYIEGEKKAIGQDADKRLALVAAWAKANLDEQGFNDLREAATSAAAFRTIERLVSMNRQAPLPKVGNDVPAVSGISDETVRAMHNELDAQGRRKYDYDPDHRKKVKAAYEQLYGNQPQTQIVGR